MYNKILVPLDGSKLAECVIPHLETFITGLEIKNVVLVKVEKPVPTTVRGDWQQKEEEQKAAAKAYLDQVAERVKPNGTKLYTEVIFGNVADSLAHYAEDNNCDLILIGTHGRTGFSRLAKGSVAEDVLHSTAVPILIIKDEGKSNEMPVETPL
jgi:nucleotide-binding universal stress UspA family protein